MKHLLVFRFPFIIKTHEYLNISMSFSPYDMIFATYIFIIPTTIGSKVVNQ
jgi:hypothetical protein